VQERIRGALLLVIIVDFGEQRTTQERESSIDKENENGLQEPLRSRKNTGSRGEKE